MGAGSLSAGGEVERAAPRLALPDLKGGGVLLSPSGLLQAWL